MTDQYKKKVPVDTETIHKGGEKSKFGSVKSGSSKQQTGQKVTEELKGTDRFSNKIKSGSTKQQTGRETITEDERKKSGDYSKLGKK